MPFAADVAALATPPNAVVTAARQTTWTTITVRPGDTLWDLAITHRTTVAAIVEKNRLARGGAMLHIGQQLLVPTPATGPAAQRTRPAPAAAKSAKPAKGQSSATSSSTRRPSSSTGTTPSRVHVVRTGETMWGIAAQYRVPLTKLLAANRLSASSYIYAGQRISIPGVGAGQAARSTSKPTTRTATKQEATTPAKPPTARERAAAASRARLAATPVPTRAETAALIRTIATRHGVDPKLALAIGWIESGWYQRAVSPTNAVGVMQLMPDTGRWASQLAGRSLDLYDARDNITAGVLVLRALQTLADSQDQAIAGYYQGLYSVRARGLFTDTVAYVASVKAIAARL